VVSSKKNVYTRATLC